MKPWRADAFLKGLSRCECVCLSHVENSSSAPASEFRNLTEHNIPIPAPESSDSFRTVFNGQTSVKVQVYKGEGMIAKANHRLGAFSLTGITPTRAGGASIEVTFTVDEGPDPDRFGVRADNKQAITTTSDMSCLSKAKINRMVEKAETFKAQDRAAVARVAASLNGMRFINEPTAAAVLTVSAFRFRRRHISCLASRNLQWNVRGEEPGGDFHLGGQEFTNLLIDHLKAELGKKHGTSVDDSPRTLNLLREAADKAKIQSSGA
ncbi:Heat shock- 70 kDa protein 2 [Tilletia horrida]|nr:Heat shock- 70 kDa protein 2 [Tilletia horrida]